MNRTTKHKYVYIITLLLTIETLCFIELSSQDNARISTLTQQTATLTATVDKLTAQNAALQAAHAKMSQYKAEQDKLSTDKADRSGERLTSIGKWKVTGYCSCEKCCGKWALNRPNGIVYGRDGKTELIPDVSVAADLPFGTRLMIQGKEYIVHDKPAEWVIEAGKVVDLYCGSDHEAAWDVGNEAGFKKSAKEISYENREIDSKKP